MPIWNGQFERLPSCGCQEPPAVVTWTKIWTTAIRPFGHGSARVGFKGLDYAARDLGGRPALGAVRYHGESQPVIVDRVFTFQR